MTEDRIRELFREMRDEPVPADSRARVRLAVAERAGSWTERFRNHWKAAAAILVPACLVLIAIFARESAPVLKPVKPAVAEKTLPIEVPAPEYPAPRPMPAMHRSVRASHQVAIARKRDDEGGTVIRIETPDPDVVILLVGG